jgi:hypothetical protein
MLIIRVFFGLVGLALIVFGGAVVVATERSARSPDGEVDANSRVLLIGRGLVEAALGVLLLGIAVTADRTVGIWLTVAVGAFVLGEFIVRQVFLKKKRQAAGLDPRGGSGGEGD